MSSIGNHKDWVDRYVGNKLDDEDRAKFELELMESSQLQDELAVALSIRQILAKSGDDPARASKKYASDREQHARWKTATLVLMILTVVLAVVVANLFLQWRKDRQDLETPLAPVLMPQTEVIIVPLDLPPPSAEDVSDLVVERPSNDGAIVLDIHLPPAFQKLKLISFSLTPDSADRILE